MLLCSLLFKISVCDLSPPKTSQKRGRPRFWESSVFLLLFCLLLWPKPGFAFNFQQAVEQLSGKNCQGAYAAKVRNSQAALLRVYSASIAEGTSKEHLTVLEECLTRLTEVFRTRTFELMPDLTDVISSVEKRLQDAAQKLCQETFYALRREENEWLHVFEYAQSTARRQVPDWSKLADLLKTGNATVSQTATQRLKALLEDLP